MNRLYKEEERMLREYRDVATDKLLSLTEILRSLGDGGFTGYIKINYTQGNIGRVEKFEEILKK
jgi:hypothetical protein